MIWFIYAVLAAFCWGIGQVLLKQGYKNFSPRFIYLLDSCFQIVIYLPFIFIMGLSFESWPLVLLLSLGTVIANWFYYYALSKGELALTGTILASYPSIVILLSFLFLGERLNIVQLVAIAMVILGCVFIALPQGKQKFTFEIWLIWAIAAAIVIGCADFLSKFAITKNGPYLFMFFLSIFQLPVACLYYFSQKKQAKILPKMSAQIWIASLTGVFLLVSGLLFLYLGFNTGPASLVSPISGAYVIITVILSLLFLKEKVNRNQLIGIILAVVGILLTSL